MPSGTTPIWRLTSTARDEKFSPSSCTRPDVGASSPVSILMVVDFPAPLGPRNPKNCPAVTHRSILSTAVSAPKRRVSFSVAMAKSVIYFPRVDNSQQTLARRCRSLWHLTPHAIALARYYSLDGSLL